MNANRIFLILFSCALGITSTQAQSEVSVLSSSIALQGISQTESSLVTLSTPFLSVEQNTRNGVFGLVVLRQDEEIQRFSFSNPISTPLVKDNYVYVLESRSNESVLRVYEIAETGKLLFSSFKKLPIAQTIRQYADLLLVEGMESVYVFDFTHPNHPDLVRISSPSALRLGLISTPAAKVYPNPSVADWHIDLSSFPQGDYTISISDMEGKTLFSQNANNEEVIVPNTYSYGTYFYTVFQNRLPIQHGRLVSNK
ncbi:MAG: T9SS type A sorting domain-containing protein [Bacteroidia bacterium]